MSWNTETWFYPTGDLLTACPNCGGLVTVGTEYDWPAELGGDPVGHKCICNQCRAEWLEDECPPDFATPNGIYWNTESGLAFYTEELAAAQHQAVQE